MKLRIEKSVTVITPTIGSSKLADAIESVQRQTYGNLEHFVVVDGYDYKDATDLAFRSAWERFPDGNEKAARAMVLIHNTGKTGGNFYGHRIYAGIPHLLNSDYIFFLDEDNWYEPDHVASLVDVLEQGNDFAFSLRKIFTNEKQYVADDNCESLGKWPIYFTHDNPQYLIDTSSYAYRKEFIQKTCHLWHSGWGGDRRYLYSVMQNARFDTNGKHTLCYRLDGNPNSVTGDFFIKGNETQSQYYKEGFPWLKQST